VSTRSLPRSCTGRKLTLQRPTTGIGSSRTSDSEDATSSKPPVSIPTRNSTRVALRFSTNRRTPSPGWRSSLVSSHVPSRYNTNTFSSFQNHYQSWQNHFQVKTIKQYLYNFLSLKINQIGSSGL